VSADGKAVVPVEGGLALRTFHPRTDAVLSPVFLFDFAVEIDPAAENDIVRIVSRDPALPAPFAVRNTAVRFTPSTGELVIMMGDLVVTEEWAEHLGQPDLAGQWMGVFDLELRSPPARVEDIAPAEPARSPEPGAMLDVTLGELYGIASVGHSGEYPAGTAGLSAATTSCNTGQVDVPWLAPMAETHPFIGLALFRLDPDGTLEMIGQNWTKHGFFALSFDQCNLGCEASDGSYLEVGCSDTYGVGNNASRYVLGPRHEIDPFRGTWEACGSFFDAVPVDCERDYFGSEEDFVVHTLEVFDGDLGHPGATYYYEGGYIVADDAIRENSIGWRECTMSWNGKTWTLADVGASRVPDYGPLLHTWGDEQVTSPVAADDGEVILATRVTDLGGGQWHYEYALYNWYSNRGVYSFSVPVGSANVSSIEFHDIDQDAGNDWMVNVDERFVTWSTDDYATDPDAHVLLYQTMFNFGFDADVPPEPGSVALGIFKPGLGNSLFLNVPTPPHDLTAVLSGNAPTDFALLPNEPNPFSETTEIRFFLAQGGPVRLTVFDVRGRLAQVVVDGPAPAGLSTVRWDGRDRWGTRLASGVYFFRLEAESRSRTIKGTLVR
jgi:hypothetical protein